jgi:F-type H+-transporting ATPase subunit a
VGLYRLFTPVFHSLGMPAEAADGLAKSLFQPFMVTTWLICIGLIVLALAARKRLERIPKRNLGGFMELVVEALQNFTEGAIGPGGKEHAWFISSLFIFIVVANWIGLVPGVLSPIGVSEEDKITGINTTAALAITAIIYVHFVAIRKAGLKSYLKHFVGEPVWLAPLNIPIHIVGELARPLSLAFRLFGNIGGEDKVLHLLATTLFIASFPLHAPMTLFAVFTGILQAYVFTALTCSYIGGFIAHDEERHEEGGRAAHAV